MAVDRVAIDLKAAFRLRGSFREQGLWASRGQPDFDPECIGDGREDLRLASSAYSGEVGTGSPIRICAKQTNLAHVPIPQERNVRWKPRSSPKQTSRLTTLPVLAAHATIGTTAMAAGGECSPRANASRSLGRRQRGGTGMVHQHPLQFEACGCIALLEGRVAPDLPTIVVWPAKQLGDLAHGPGRDFLHRTYLRGELFQKRRVFQDLPRRGS